MFACELNGVIDNFFNDADIDIQLMSRLKSVDISRNVSPQLRKLDNDKIDEKELTLALEKEFDLDHEEKENHTNNIKKIKMGHYLFENLNEYFMNRPEFINPTSAVYFQKVVYALLNKKGYEVLEYKKTICTLKNY